MLFYIDQIIYFCIIKLENQKGIFFFFQFFQIIGDLYHRPIIKKELKPKVAKVLDFMHSNIDAVKEIFDEEMAVIVIHITQT